MSHRNKRATSRGRKKITVTPLTNIGLGPFGNYSKHVYPMIIGKIDVGLLLHYHVVEDFVAVCNSI